jgi:hypothetical protein
MDIESGSQGGGGSETEASRWQSAAPTRKRYA